MNELKVGDVFVSKKNHPCGENKWQITRLGADVKIKCVKCGHSVFVSFDKLKKIVKNFVSVEGRDDKDSQ